MKKVRLGFGLVIVALALLMASAKGIAGNLENGSVDASGLRSWGLTGRDTTLAPETSPVANVTSGAVAAHGDVALVQAIIDPWCGEIPVTVHEGTGGEAGFTKSWRPLSWPPLSWPPLFAQGGDVTEYIKVGLAWPADHPATQAVALHECAHIMQYRAYGYDWPALDSAMREVFPDGPHSPVEHMADCMSEVMGAERRGRSMDGQSYEAGYGGSCSPEQYDAAAMVVDGRRL